MPKKPTPPQPDRDGHKRRCTATSKRKAKALGVAAGHPDARCSSFAVKGFDVCRMHGAGNGKDRFSYAHGLSISRVSRVFPAA